MFKIIAVFVMTLFGRIYVRINILLTIETYIFMTASFHKRWMFGPNKLFLSAIFY